MGSGRLKPVSLAQQVWSPVMVLFIDIMLLRQIRRQPGHTFWADDVSPVDSDATAFEQVVGYRQVTDGHLLAVAVRRGGILATFDRGVAELAPSMPTAVDQIP